MRSSEWRTLAYAGAEGEPLRDQRKSTLQRSMPFAAFSKCTSKSPSSTPRD